MSNAIQSFLTENKVLNTNYNVSGESISSYESYKKLCLEVENNFDEFWSGYATDLLSWSKIFTKVLDDSNKPHYKWFVDGSMNVTVNCLDIHLTNGNANKIAIIFESDDGEVLKITYKDLLKRVCKFANGLKNLGYKIGDKCIIYMPMSIEVIVAMHACARLGIIHSVVFGGFSSKSLHERILDIGASLIITSDYQKRGGKKIPLKAAVDAAIISGNCESIKNVIVYKRAGDDINWLSSRDLWMDDLEKNQLDYCEPVFVNSEHPLFVLYTSGSTGKPKGIQHSSAGYLLWAKMTMRWTFDIRGDDVFWCTADVGWITGHTYIAYGPLSMGLTQVIFEGIPTYPNSARFWKMIERHKVSIFYTAPTAIRSLIKSSDNDRSVHPDNFDLSSLRILGSVGEPISPDTWRWYYKNVGNENCPIADTWWQTETGGHMITPLPCLNYLKPGSCSLPLPGICAAVVDESGEDVPNSTGGFLVIKKPWPGMIRNIWGNTDRFITSYFPEELHGYYLAGDGAQRDNDGYFWIMGRIDDVLNVSGHRLGTMEIESALVSHSKVSEAAVIGRSDDTTGEAVVAFIVMKGERPYNDEAINIAKELRNWIACEIGPIAKPKDIIFGDSLPKTRSGKIMRRLLRAIANGENINQDTSTIENMSIFDNFSITF
ncbi:acetyl-CoA synthetase [Candidatus Kinetoplastibacterium oncopeltii TCC290E]|uniref:Acetate--CoA ligase n=1 Tax=Candidatus Kinetoplastidibacterium stringomonadis TCC290E TaxID=1208920 RepID=M1M8X5_9PROT|nr:acetate--CoA ligase [Candidatus Kinetoplastibacterium oncopeltii]AGF48435.1 acetyl-CoA synthetase [Candidatus Kinetoplastibacterium oncopeltii TCC290E]